VTGYNPKVVAVLLDAVWGTKHIVLPCGTENWDGLMGEKGRGEIQRYGQATVVMAAFSSNTRI
jgi:hypothetical protein